MFKVKGQRSRSRRKVMYQQQKRHTATDRFSDFKLGMASWRGIRRPQVAMHSQLPRFLVFAIFIRKMFKMS